MVSCAGHITRIIVVQYNGYNLAKTKEHLIYFTFSVTDIYYFKMCVQLLFLFDVLCAGSPVTNHVTKSEQQALEELQRGKSQETTHLCLQVTTPQHTITHDYQDTR